MVTSVASVVCQVSVVVCPFSMLAGLAVSEAVGAAAGGGGGGGGGGGASFFLQALSASIAARAATNAIHFILLFIFTSYPPTTANQSPLSKYKL